jgi:predicted TIM-barrel fold metal-dependent hydrolase
VEWAGENNILFETDFPHESRNLVTPETVYRATHDQLAKVTERVRRKILFENAVDLFGIDLAAATGGM